MVSRIVAMKEDRDAGLIDPVMTLNGVKATVTGTIPYNNYLVYKGGAKARVYDPNWNFVRDLPVTGRGFEAKKGNNAFSVASKSPDTWLSSRIKVEDTANRIAIRKPTAAQ
jgi:hypothetical protein